MQSLSDLLRADPFCEDAVHARLENLGFLETPEEKPEKKKGTPQRAFSSTRRRTRISKVNDTSTPFAPTRPTARAAKLIDSLASNAGERESLFKVLDEILEDLSRAADPLKALLNFSRLCDSTGDRAGFFHQLDEHPALRFRLAQLMGFAQSLADTLIREPELVESLNTPATAASRPGSSWGRRSA